MTSRILEEELPAQAHRYRYRVDFQRGTRTSTEPQSRKRGREVADEGQRKRPREEDVILLSSDNEDTKPIVALGGRRFSPVTVDSTTNTSGTEDMEEIDDTSLEDDIPVEEFLGSSKMVHAESSGTTSSSSRNKGKGKEVDRQESLDLQEELECFICCIPHFPWNELTNSDANDCSVCLLSLWPWRMWTLQ